tara:strand:- start:613 stop:1074 length:462 start_codon:yes stop_codon:yes gene_type:complete
VLKSIQNIFRHRNQEVSDSSEIYQRELAYASLLVEVIKSDDKFDDRERAKLFDVLSEKLEIRDDELQNFAELAKQKSDESTSLYEFTREINDKYEYDEKVKLIEDLWRIAYSDGQLDKYEDYVIRKIADLIYVTHSDFIKSKLSVKNQPTSGV